jgi:hypothetical protein
MSRAASELAHLFRALKAPAAARALPVLAERAREEQWSYERFTEALLSTEVSSRDSHGGEGRIKAARFPARKTLEEFDFTFQRSALPAPLSRHRGDDPKPDRRRCTMGMAIATSITIAVLLAAIGLGLGASVGIAALAALAAR